MLLENQFYEFAIILAIAATIGAIGRLLRQPLIVTFIAVGICVGPAWLGIATAGDQIELLARMGIAILLFLVGLRLDMQVIRSMGPVALATGLRQVLFTSVVGFLIAQDIVVVLSPLPRKGGVRSVPLSSALLAGFLGERGQESARPTYVSQAGFQTKH